MECCHRNLGDFDEARRASNLEVDPKTGAEELRTCMHVIKQPEDPRAMVGT